MSAPRTRLLGGLSARRQAWSAVAAAALLVALTVTLRSQRGDVSLTLVFLLYLAAVVALSAAGGPLVGVATALAGFLLVNFFFTEPVHTFDVAEPEVLAELLIFLAVSGTVATLVDTASRRLGQIEEHEAEAARLGAANELRTALLRAVSHDLRTPLATAKVATSSLLATDVDLTPDARAELLALADTEIDRLSAIVENLLDAGRLQAGVLRAELRATATDDVLQATLAALPERERPRVMAWIGTGATGLFTDAALLERVLANLIANALAADPAGHIAVNADLADDPAWMTLEVIDHGPGLPAEQRSTAFEPFQRLGDRSATTGIGLGLAICKGLCDALGATIELSDTPGGGLTGRVTVPTGETR